MVKGCRINTGLCKKLKVLSKKDPPKTLGTRIGCKAGTGLGDQIKGKTGIGLHIHEARWI